MSKKRAKKWSQAKPRPEPAQLKAIERLLENKDHAEAIRRIEPLVRQFPDHGGLRRALVEALEHGEGPYAAGLAAFQWAERQPNSLAAQETLLHFAVELHLIMLAEHSARRVRELGGGTPGFPLETSLKESLLVLTDGTRTRVDEVERFDIGKLHLGGEDFAGVLRWLDGLDLPAARNNRALALFHLDRIDDARDTFDATWHADPQNLFALGWALRLRLYRGDVTGARELSTPLAVAAARRLDDALHQVDALLLLEQDQLAWDAFERAIGSDWFGMGVDRSGVLLRHLGACAACRLGRGADARRLWKEALEMDPRFRLARVNLDLFDRDGKAPAFPAVCDLHQTVPITWTATLRAQKEPPSATMDALTASNAYLEALYINGDLTLRTLVGFVLEHRAKRADADAVRLLREFPRLPIGTAEERFGLLSFLRSEGLLAHDEPLDFWDGAQLRQVRLTDTEIYRDVEESDLPADLAALLGEAVALYHDQRLDAAEARLHTILQRIPDHRVALGNLAAVRSAQGRGEEARRLLRQVVAGHPDYLFARCNLAKTLIQDGKIDEADRLLEGLAERERLHIQEAFAVYGTLAMLHTAKGEDAMAQSLIDILESIVEDADDARRLAEVKQLIDRRSPLERFEGAVKALVESGAKPGNHRQ